MVSEGIRSDASDLEPSLTLWAEQFNDQPAQDTYELLPGDDGTESAADAASVGPTNSSTSPNAQTPKIDIEELWQALLTAEEESLPVATVIGEVRRNPQREHQVLLPCSSTVPASTRTLTTTLGSRGRTQRASGDVAAIWSFGIPRSAPTASSLSSAGLASRSRSGRR